jgi:signal peptidase I
MSSSENVACRSSELKCQLATEVLQSSGTLRLGVTGWSMLPAIWPGDTLVIEKVDGSDVCEGDIVLFARKHRLFAHRVISQSGNPADRLFITQGDGMPHPDEAMDSSELLGRVSLILRDGKWMEPKRSPAFLERIEAVLVRRFYWAARIIVELRVMRQREQRVSWQN